MVRSAVITGLGMYVPKKMLTNEDIEQMLNRPGTADWLVENVGIRRRHVMADDEVTSDLALHASHEALEKAGMDFITTSSKWWDFTASWAVEQYNTYRQFAPSVSFPENHDTPRLSFETNGRKDIQVFRYLFSAFFSAGVMITSGYEFGFQKKTDVVTTQPDDWGPKIFDISSTLLFLTVLCTSIKLTELTFCPFLSNKYEYKVN